MSMKIDQEVLSVLSRANIAGSMLKLTGQLDRALYTRTNKVLEAAGGKWDRKAGAHVFNADAEERMEQILLTGDVVVPKDEFDFFPTPPSVVLEMLAAANVQPQHRVLEPSAGRGNIALQFAAMAQVDCIEILEDNCRFLEAGPYASVKCHDFLAVEPYPLYDRVVMNPPFSKRRDIKHVLHALKFVKPGGRLVAIMPPSFTYRTDALTTDFNSTLAAYGGKLQPLPDGSFKSSGTMVSTVMVVIDKPEAA
jgi:predicted RNA methylase